MGESETNRRHVPDDRAAPSGVPGSRDRPHGGPGPRLFRGIGYGLMLAGLLWAALVVGLAVWLLV